MVTSDGAVGVADVMALAAPIVPLMQAVASFELDDGPLVLSSTLFAARSIL